MAGKPPILVGDKQADQGTVEGFVLEVNLGEDDPGYDDSIDFTQDFAVIRHGLRRDKQPMQTLLREAIWESRGDDPLHGVARTYELSADWRATFDRALDWPMHPWAGMVRPLSEMIAADGWHVLAFGGFVRDLLLGKDPQTKGVINDLDICGTVPAARFREYCYELQVEAAGGHGWRRNAFWHMETTLNQMVHIRRLRRVEREPMLETRPSLQYASLKRRERKNPATKANEWLFGSSFVEDSTWRDVRFNTLMYDPVEGTIIDPTGHGLSDLGLSPADLQGQPRTRSAPRTVQPLDIPAGAGSEFVANAIVRVFKQVIDWHESDADFAPVERWTKAHADLLGDNLAQPDTLVLVHERLKQLRDYSLGCGRVIPLPDVRERCLGPTLNGLLEPVLGSTGARAARGGRVPKVVGNGIAPFDRQTGVIDLGKAYSAQDGTTSGAQRQFASLLQGYSHHMAEVVLGKSAEGHEPTTVNVTGLILVPPDGHPDLPTYVELSGGRPLAVTEPELAVYQARDDDPDR